MLEGFSLGNYLLLVDYTGRLFREGKAAISREVAAIFDRLGSRRGNLAGTAGEAEQGPSLRPFLRGQSAAPARSRGTPASEARAEPGRMPGVVALAQGSRGDLIRAPGGDSPRRLGDQRPEIAGVSAKSEKSSHEPVNWVVGSCPEASEADSIEVGSPT